ncbi:uncharacterized protein [Chelonus insularis]|uniref:uncharacterized protein n=1 Tax=Chelonus insularis TaxID=460826 RepID=UPI00158E12C2|nr:uncharacterized protein LOC118067627 [Chelonus insularis]
MILRNCLILLSIWLSLSTVIEGIESERWSRQTANSEWIPLTRPRAQQSQSQIPVALNQAQLPALQSINLSPALRQEYQQQLLQLQKTQESINKILMLQQQVRAQQQLLQNQAYLPNVVGPDDERQQFRPNSVPNGQPFTASNQEGLVSSPQLSSEALPSVYSAQQFKSHSDQEVQEIPSGSSSTEEKGENSDEEIQVVYVPAETLAQRGQSKEERNRDHKQFSIPQQQQQRYQVDQIGATGSGEDGSYTPQYVHFPRGQEAEQFFKDARQKELDRLNEERQQIQKQANIHAAARMREQERARQREAEKKLQELAKIEELAKQRELERIREARERARIEELERARERAMKLKEEKAKQEIERLAAVERQKNAVKELEKLAKQEEEVRAKELAAKKQHLHDQSDEINHHQHHTETTKSKNSRLRNKTRPRVHHKTHEEYEQNQESSTLPPPNQPPLAVFMGSDLEAQEVRVVDVLRVLKDSKSIAVLDQVTADTPKVFVGPSNLGPPRGYVKFDLPYLSSLDTNRVERRVDKIPFFVAPLSFNPPQGYSKIPFPAPHIGSVIVNNLEDGGASFGDNRKPVPNPLIEPNSFIPPTDQGSTPYQTYESSTASPYSPYTQEQATPQYSSPVYPSTHEDRYKYRQQQYEQGGIPNLESQESPSISPYQEEVTAAPRPQEYSEQTYLSQVTPDGYQRPNVVSSFSYSQNPISTTPVYQDSYAHTRTQPNKDQELTSQLAQINQHDYSQHQHTENSYIHPSQQPGLSHQHHLYQISPNVQGSYEDPSQSGPNQYNLPAELPPIHPQLPGLVNSLLEGKDADKTTTITTTTPEPTTTTTTEATTTNYRTRVRQRGRIASRPTTSTTTSSPGITKSYERTRRPFNRSRSRYTTSTTEEYRDTSYEPTKAKVPDTTQRYNNQEQYRRPVSTRAQKLKNRGGDRNSYETTTLNQIPSQETLSDEGSLPEDSNNVRQSTYSHYNVQVGTESPSAYLHEGSMETSPISFSTERDYSKIPNYPSLSSSHRNEKVGVNAGISQQRYQDKYHAPASGYSENLEGQTVGFEYDTREGVRDSTPSILSSPADYNYYQDKSESAEPGVQTAAPVYSQILEYRPGTRPDMVGQTQETGALIDDTQGLISTAITERELETTTELPLTTTTSAPVILRQRVRARLGGRPRQDSAIQTQPRGPQEEYVRFSAVNTPNRSSTTNRGRDPTRPRPKTRPNYYNQAQVQSEGNEYVRIQSANRPYPKTIVQAAAPRTTTTTIAPLTTTEDSSLQDDDEYGFIRPPSFNQPHHQISSKFRAPDSQIQLQNVGPTDETAEDSSPTYSQVPKHRQKYQSPHRPRPTIKSSTSPITTLPPTSPESSSFTTKPRVRAEEPKNRLKVRGRRPLRRRPTTTTTTTTSTTEYILEGNNNLPLEENYPKVPINPTAGSIEKQLYDSNYETLPPNSGSLGGPSRADYVDESYPTQEFMLNFGASSLIEEQQDQSQSMHHPGHNYHVASNYRHDSSGSRLRPYSNHAVAPEHDIYGSESQWSTKLTKSSFQPINQLNHDEEQMREEKQYQGQDKENEPEIITAKPEEIMTVIVTSDNETNITRNDSSEMTTESADSGMKMSAVEMKPESGENVPQRRRLGGRRRRVRVRVRPAQSDDFVTAESQNFNSAVNNLVQDQIKYTIPATSSSEFIQKTTESVEKQPSTTNYSEISNGDESITPSDSTTINYTEIPEYTKQLDVSTLQPVNNEESVETKSPQVTTTTENSQTQFDTTLNDNSTATSLTTTLSIPRKSWDSLTAYNVWLKKKMEKTLISGDNEFKTGDKDGNEDTKTSNNHSEENSHPKNHRSEWSEVRYPSDRNIYGYGRSEKTTTTTQVPGLVTKPSGDVNALSDYVQAIFESMKTADEERAIIDNAPNLWNDETKSTTQVYDFPSALSTIIGIKKTSSESAEEDKDFKAENNEDVSALSNDDEKEGINKVTEVSPTPTESTSSKEEPTTLLQTSTEALTSDSGISTTIDASTTIEPTTSTAKNAAEMLGAILRTSTSTKVSHMTEICYRGRCVMTKPRKDFHER